MTAVKTSEVAPGIDKLVTIADRVGARAGAVDCGEIDVRIGLAELGCAGLLALGAAKQPGSLLDQARVLRTLAHECMATAFSAWAQRMAIGYLARWGNDELRSALLPELTTGTRSGATAMATAFQDALGLREVPVAATHEGDQVVLQGTIPWASNLFDGSTVVVLPARTNDGGRMIVAITTDLAGVELLPYPSLLALGATASTSVRLHSVRVPSSWVLTTHFADFLTDVRPSFLLLQTAFCLGLADAAIAGAAGRFDRATQVLLADHDQLIERRDQLDRRHRNLLVAPQHEPRDLVRLRLFAGTLAVDASRHEGAVRGGAGYLAASPVARRVREAAFLPIQSPTEAQLRWELSHSA